MNRQRLLELAGVIAVGANMNNPSFEPNAGANSTVDDPINGQGSSGYAVTGDDGEMDPIAKMKAEIEKGKENPEAAMAALESISVMLDDFERMNSDEEPDETPDMTGDLEGTM